MLVGGTYLRPCPPLWKLQRRFCTILHTSASANRSEKLSLAEEVAFWSIYRSRCVDIFRADAVIFASGNRHARGALLPNRAVLELAKLGASEASNRKAEARFDRGVEAIAKVFNAVDSEGDVARRRIYKYLERVPLGE